MDKIVQECWNDWVDSVRKREMICPLKGKVIDIPVNAPIGLMGKTSNTMGTISPIPRASIDFSLKLWMPMISPFKFPRAIEFIEKAIRAYYNEPEPLPITWPEGVSFHDAFFPDSLEPYKGPLRNMSNTGQIGWL